MQHDFTTSSARDQPTTGQIKIVGESKEKRRGEENGQKTAKRTMLGIPSFITKTCWQLGHTMLPSTTEIYRCTPPKGLMNQFDVDGHLND
jgi:hypothetical protein